ncbi:MAG: NADAR family protein, partial [Bacteroidaceae bacterium]|nr:NADAR family protein [Bacteroidaceae bacterium]
MEKKNVVFFYGVKNVNGEFSNHYVREFKVNGNTFNCVEQFMMAQKALIFRDFETFNKVMNSKDPVEMKHLGREVKNFDAEKWDGVKMKVVKRAVMAKFSQNWDLRELLLQTGDRLIAESNPMDRIWGIGICKSDKDVMNKMDEWGENLLGKIMMEVREELKGMEFDDEMEDVVVVSEKRKSGDEGEKEVAV